MQSIEDRRDRAIGALVGLAVGDALGAPVEFMARDSFPPVTGYRDGGPFNLKAGEWTDDTSMALGLADALLEDPLLATAKVMENWLSWYREGAYSHKGRCFDIGNQTAKALSGYAQTGMFPGPTSAAGNGSIMRLAPVITRHWQTPEVALQIVEKQTVLTHNNPECVAAGRAMAAILLDLMRRKTPEISLPNLARAEVKSTGYVKDTLEAALWCLRQGTNFESVALLAANLGDDSDTVGAVAGQLAGAKYGLSGIPSRLIRGLAWSERILAAATSLFEAGSVA